MNNRILSYNIEREKNGTDYICSQEDRKLLNELFVEINRKCGTDVNFLAEIDAFNIIGSGEVIVKYIKNFSSESVKGYLIPQMVADRIKDCDKLVLQLYTDFRLSDEYISKPGYPAPAHIYVRYDNAFKKLKPKKLADELIKLAHNPRDAFYLPFTMRMLASWRIPEMRDLLISYLNSDNLTLHDIGISNNSEEKFCPSLEFIKRELKFTAISGLKYYPSPEIQRLIEHFSTSDDKDIKLAAKRILKALSI